MPTRRHFLIGSAAVAGGVALGVKFDLPERLPDTIDVEPGQTALTPYVVVDSAGITIIAPRAEMGQGIHTTLAALVAEELDVAFHQVRVQHGPASELYSNQIMHNPGRLRNWVSASAASQGTGAQTSVRDAYVKMRKAGAAARTVLVEAAAQRLGVGPETLTTRDGFVMDADGNAISYVDLAAAAARYQPPEDPPLKARSQWRLLGTSLPRVDMPAKCTGTAQYAIDVTLPDMLFATVRRNPGRGGRMRGFDATRALAMPGVKHVVAMDAGIIVIATNTWLAIRAAEQVDVDWETAAYPPSTDDHRRRIEQEFDKAPYFRPVDRGDVDAALGDGVSIEGVYRVPYLAHATMEPMAATALFDGGRLDIWSGNQNPTKARLIGARLTGLDKDAVRVHTTYMGGGFGRRFEFDDVEAAIHAALALPGVPVRVTYSREEDMTQDRYRPMATGRFRARIDDGRPTALDLGLSAPSLFVSSGARRIIGGKRKDIPEKDRSITMGAASQPYTFEHMRVTAYRPDDLLPVGWWRSVGESQNVFFIESIIDEIAHAAGTDPLELRLSLLEDTPSRKVLESVAEMSDWGTALPPGRARGIAYALASGQATAQVIEIAHTEAGIHLHRAWVAVDVGVALDPRNIEAQVQGALNFGLSAAIFGEITVSGGVVDQRNYDTYPLLRMYQAPRVDVRVLEMADKIKGVGEAGTPAAAPALANAIFAATGRRIRDLPFRKHLNFV